MPSYTHAEANHVRGDRVDDRGLFFLPAIAVAAGIGLALWAGWIALKTVWYVLSGLACAFFVVFLVIPLAIGGIVTGLLGLLF